MKKQRPCRLTQRDLRLFRYLFATKGATLKQINRDIMASASYRTAHYRLKQLVDAGYLVRDGIELGRIKGFYSLPKRVLSSGLLFDFELKNKETRTQKPSHEIALVDIRSKLMKIKGFEGYLTENELQNGFNNQIEYPLDDFINLNSDGFLRFRNKSRVYNGAVEYEQSDKGKARYSRLFKEYYLSEHVGFIFYITVNKRLAKSLQNIDHSVRGDIKSRIFTTTIDELRQADEVLTFTNSSSSVLNLSLRPG